MIHRVRLADGTVHKECAGFQIVHPGSPEVPKQGRTKARPFVPRTVRFLTATGAVEVSESDLLQIDPPLRDGDLTV
jgi:hypothetical protein